MSYRSTILLADLVGGVYLHLYSTTDPNIVKVHGREVEPEIILDIYVADRCDIRMRVDLDSPLSNDLAQLDPSLKHIRERREILK